MASMLITNLSDVVTGDWRRPLHGDRSIYIQDGIIHQIGTSRTSADTVINAHGLLAVPGLIDTHVHPSFGDFSYAQNSFGWMTAYLNGGVTTLISSGEPWIPGLPLNPPDARLLKYLAILVKRCSDNLPIKAPRLVAGTLLLAPGLTEADFDEVAQAGIQCVKFVFYPYSENGNEAKRYVQWCHERGIVVKLHSGGTSGSGISRQAGARIVKELLPDVVAHINGGPISMPLKEIETVVKETHCYLEVSFSGIFRRTMELMDIVAREGAQARVILATDTPSGTGVIPRGMLLNVAFLSSLGVVAPEVALCMATGNAARAHHLPTGLLQDGSPADLLLVGTIAGTNGKDVLDALRLGEIPGISCVIVGGQLVVRGQGTTTPPPQVLATVEKEDRAITMA